MYGHHLSNCDLFSRPTLCTPADLTFVIDNKDYVLEPKDYVLEEDGYVVCACGIL